MQIWWYKAYLIKDIGILMKYANLGNETSNDGQIQSNNNNSQGDKIRVSGKVLSNLIMQLRKVCLHPFLFQGAEEDIDETTLEQIIGASGKLAVLDKLLCSLYQKGHRVVLFSQLTRVLDILDDYAKLRGWEYIRFDGSTARAHRNYLVNSFNAPNSTKFLFLMSTRSGGVGLNLQTADTCILYDSDWNPQPDIQAMAR
jgi:SWI/SNF-related matrix-associated actin-dependent regulator of chromatin subfamily A member 5